MDTAMRANARPSLSLIAQSYLADLRQWIERLVTGYALACGFMLVGAVSLLVAIGIGGAAAFHAIDLRYGIWIAYAAIGGVFLLLGLLGLGTGRGLLARPAPAAPRSGQQADMLKRAVAVPVAARLIATSRSGAGVNADPTTQVLAAGAAVMLIGWFAVSRFKRPRDVIQD
nr:hypothetical protein G6P99_36630 [Bradyrhizobium sp. 6(2017)]